MDIAICQVSPRRTSIDRGCTFVSCCQTAYCTCKCKHALNYPKPLHLLSLATSLYDNPLSSGKQLFVSPLVPLTINLQRLEWRSPRQQFGEITPQHADGPRAKGPNPRLKTREETREKSGSTTGAKTTGGTECYHALLASSTGYISGKAKSDVRENLFFQVEATPICWTKLGEAV